MLALRSRWSDPMIPLWGLCAVMVALAVSGAGIETGEWLAAALALGAAASMGCTARRHPATRSVSVPLAIGTATYGTGSLIWAVMRMLDPATTSPTIADPLWLSFYVFVILAVLGPVVRGGARSPWLDMATAALAVAAVGVQWILMPLGGASPLAVVINGAYPVLDVLVVAAFAAAAVCTGWNRTAGLCVLGFGLFLTADLIYFQDIMAGVVGIAWLPNVIWSAGLLVIAHGVRTPPSGLRVAGGHSVALPAGFAAVALVVLLVGAMTGVRTGAAVLAAGAILAALARLVATVRLERALHDSRRLALTDELTGLPNRRALIAATEAALDRGEPTALVLLDLDGFKDVNDSLGHAAGDLLLPLVGVRLRAALAGDALLARLGGDEFAALLPPTAATMRAETLLRALRAPFDLDGVVVHIGASAGVAWTPEHGRSSGELLRRADEAMYRAKDARGTVVTAVRHDNASGRRRIELLGALADAIDAGDAVPHFQPQLSPDGRRILGAEALTRWTHPRLGLLEPCDFLPGRAQGGLGRTLTRSNLLAAAAHAASWRQAGMHVPVAVNLCAADLAEDGLLDDLDAACRAHGIPAALLRLEVTETVVMADPVECVARLHQLRDTGVGLSLDDFGVDRSSLSWLDVMPVDEVKIDRGFVARLDRPRTAEIVEATAGLARRLGLRVVAEGVETTAQRAALEAMGVDALQGWLFSPALPAGELLAWADRRMAVA